MELNMKKNTLNEIKNIVKRHAKIDDIRLDENKANIVINATYAKENEIKITFRKSNDMLVFKAIVVPLLTNEEAIQVVLDDIISVDENFHGSVTSETTCELTKVTNFSNLNDKEAKKLIMSDFDSFIKLLDSNADKIICKEVSKSEQADKENDNSGEYNKDENIIEEKEDDDISEIEMLMESIKNDEKEINNIKYKLGEKKEKHYKLKADKKNSNREIRKEAINKEELKEDANSKDINNCMLLDVEKIFEERKNQADQRENVLNEYAQKLKNKEAELERKEKELDTEYIKKNIESENQCKKLKEELRKEYLIKEAELDKRLRDLDNEKNDLSVKKQQIDFEFKKLEVERENIKIERNNLAEQKDLLGVNYHYDNDKKIEELNSVIKDLEYKYTILMDGIDKLKATSEKKDVLIKKLHGKIAEISSVKDNKEKNDLSISEELEHCKLKNKEYSDKIQDLSDEIKKITVEKNNLINELDLVSKDKTETEEKFNTEIIQLKSEIMNLKEEKSEEMQEKNTKSKALSIIDDVNNIGIKLDVMPSAGDNTILYAEKEGVSYCVNVDVNIIYCEKNVKQCKKYLSDIEEWNQEDIRISYSLDSKTNKIICKYSYDNVLNAIMDIMSKFKDIV